MQDGIIGTTRASLLQAHHTDGDDDDDGYTCLIDACVFGKSGCMNDEYYGFDAGRRGLLGESELIDRQSVSQS